MPDVVLGGDDFDVRTHGRFPSRWRCSTVERVMVRLLAGKPGLAQACGVAGRAGRA